MALVVVELALEIIQALRPLMPLIQRRDRDLASQLARAASSAALNSGEAEYNDPGNRRARFHTAAGSANEARVALRAAVAWGHITAVQAQPPIAAYDRVVGMLWRLSRGP